MKYSFVDGEACESCSSRFSIIHMPIPQYSRTLSSAPSKTLSGWNFQPWTQYTLAIRLNSNLPSNPLRYKNVSSQSRNRSIARCRARLALSGQLPRLHSVSLHSNSICPGQMLDFPLRGATDVLFDKACEDFPRMLIWNRENTASRM
ncbi:uncharacterized protein BJX67DRAFT_356674 [Aspergillus lucknowensis]|uniref:Uncharacterized protein n=1 Tax=Aspergillus lucknowensis TaxID=176173 RepID=A0ABR4LPU9_9EURO